MNTKYQYILLSYFYYISMSLVNIMIKQKDTPLPLINKKSEQLKKFQITQYGKGFAFRKPKLEGQKKILNKKSGRDSNMQIYQHPQRLYSNQKIGRGSSLGQLGKSSQRQINGYNGESSDMEKKFRQTKRFLSQQNISKKLKIPQKYRGNHDHSDSQDEKKDQEIEKELLRAKHKIIPQQELTVKHKKSIFTLHHPLPSLNFNKAKDSKKQAPKQTIKLDQSRIQDQKSLSESLNKQMFQHEHEQLVGQKAVSKYYSKYKNIDRIRDKQQFIGIENPMTVILTILQNYNIPPKKMEVIKVKGYADILYLRNCGLGYGISIRAITQILARLDYFQSIDLSSNSIHADLADIIIPNLKKMKRINLGNNRIGRRGCDQILQMCSFQGCRLDELNLESNFLPDGAGVIVLMAMSKLSAKLSNNPRINQIKILNLSKNNLGMNFALKMKDFLMYDDGLVQLYLSWNQMSAKQCKYIFQGMTMNQSVKVLDMSWNNLGAQSLKAMCECVKKNKFLLHLDISFCEIDKKDTTVFAKALQTNRTIIGIHYEGNEGFIDHRGFIKLQQQLSIQGNQKSQQSAHKVILDKKVSRPMPIPVRRGLVRKINGLNKCKMQNQFKQYIVKDICWICEGWQQRYFKLEKQDGDIMGFLHLEFQQFKSIPMNLQATYFDVMRMCPPTNITFFFSKVKKVKKAIYHTKSKFHPLHQQTQPNTNDKKMSFQPPLYLKNLKIAGKTVKQVKVEQLNFQPHNFQSQMFDQHYNCLLHCQPRTQEVKITVDLGKIKPKVKQQPKQAKRVIPPTKIEVIDLNRLDVEQEQSSNNQFIKKCVEFDLQNSKFNKIVKDSEQKENIRKILQNNYMMFASVFYFLANCNPNFNGIFTVSQTRFDHFIEYQAYQSKRISKAKIRLKMISSLSAVEQQAKGIASMTQVGFYSSDKTSSNVKLFSRPQFFQFLLRLGIQKWSTVPIKSKQNKQLQATEEDQLFGQQHRDQLKVLSISQGFQKMIKNLKRFYDQINPEEWRVQNMQNFQCSQVLQGYEIVLNKIYDKYAGSKQKNLGVRIKKKMLLDQFKDIFIDCKLKKTKQGLTQAEICFLNSKKLEVEDGLQQFGLNYDQFCEAMCRYAEIMNLPPLNQFKNPLFQRQENTLIVPLFLKVQSFIHAIYMNNKELRNKKLDSYIKDGIFKQQIGALIQILQEQQNFEQSSEKKQPAKSIAKLHINTLNGEQAKPKKKKITLLTLIEHLNRKFEILHQRQLEQAKKQKLKNGVISETQSQQEQPIQ